MSTFQSMIDSLQSFWAKHGCAILPSYPAEIGAGTLHPITVFNCCSNRIPNLGIAYVQPCVRPADNRGGRSCNRLYQHHQLQVLIKPVPDNIQYLYLESLSNIGIATDSQDIRFIEDNWENPSIGAYGVGWEVQWNGMEVTQYTYMQQVGGIQCPVTPIELAYGLERLAMLIQNKDSVFDILWNDSGLTYGDIFRENEDQFFSYLSRADSGCNQLKLAFEHAERTSKHWIQAGVPLVAYRYGLEACHLLNIMDAKGILGYNDRAEMLLIIKNLVKNSCELWNRAPK